MAGETATVELTAGASGANSGEDFSAGNAADKAANGQGAASTNKGDNGDLTKPKFTQAELDAIISKNNAKTEATLKAKFEHDQRLATAQAAETAAKTAEELRRAQEEKKRIENEYELSKIRGIQDTNILTHLDKAEVAPKLRPFFARLEDGKEYEETMKGRIDSFKEAFDSAVNDAVAKKIKSPAPDTSTSTSSNAGGSLASIYGPGMGK